MFKLTNSDIDVAPAREKLFNARAGALVVFEGWVRNHHEGKDVLFLEYEAYEPLCISEASAIEKDILHDYDIIDIHCIHRTGQLNIGGLAVWVGVIAEHREDAFKACANYMNQLKSRIPIWKKESFADGQVVWVRCEACAAHTHHKT